MPECMSFGIIRGDFVVLSTTSDLNVRGMREAGFSYKDWSWVRDL